MLLHRTRCLSRYRSVASSALGQNVNSAIRSKRPLDLAKDHIGEFINKEHNTQKLSINPCMTNKLCHIGLRQAKATETITLTKGFLMTTTHSFDQLLLEIIKTEDAYSVFRDSKEFSLWAYQQSLCIFIHKETCTHEIR